MVGDADYSLLMCKLEKLQSALNKLEEKVDILQNNYLHRNKPFGEIAGSLANIPYALTQGSLTDAGYKQMWRDSLSDSQDVE